MSGREKRAVTVCPADELRPGDRRIVDVGGGITIGIFNVDGEFYALRNRCPHEGAELCRGIVTGMNAASAVGEYDWVREGEILRCPWHGWEFDILTGRSIFNPHGIRVRAYDTAVEDIAEREGVEQYRVEAGESGMVVVYV